MQVSSRLSFLSFPEQRGWMSELPAVILKPGGIAVMLNITPPPAGQEGAAYPSPVNQVEGKKPFAVCPSLCPGLALQWGGCPALAGQGNTAFMLWTLCLVGWLHLSVLFSPTFCETKTAERGWRQLWSRAQTVPALGPVYKSRSFPDICHLTGADSPALQAGYHQGDIPREAMGISAASREKSLQGWGSNPRLKQGSLCHAPEVPRAHCSLLSLHK